MLKLAKSHWDRWKRANPDCWNLDDPSSWIDIRASLLDFIADFANWDASANPVFLETARELTAAAHTAVGGLPGTKPLLVDPFAGGGAIPLEALRVGLDAFASDLNPVAVLLNKAVLEYIPKYGDALKTSVDRWANWIHGRALAKLSAFYPPDPDGSTPLAYIWARTIRCEGPRCGCELPLLRSFWLARKGKEKVALRPVDAGGRERIEFELLEDVPAEEVVSGTSRGGSATCPKCGFTTPVESVRSQLRMRNGGSADARLLAVVTSQPGVRGRSYRLATQADEIATEAAVRELNRRIAAASKDFPAVPDGPINHLRGFFNIVLYGMKNWGDLFSPRQALALSTYSQLIAEAPINDEDDECRPGLAEATRTCLGLILDRVAVRCTANCVWDATTACIMQVFNQGQSLPARWEFAEMVPVIDEGSGWQTSLQYTLKVIEHGLSVETEGTCQRASATNHPLPDDSAQLFVTDPPYYAAVPYADLSDFFYSWLQRSLRGLHPDLLGEALTPKADELVSLSHRAAMYREKDSDWFEERMLLACTEGRRITAPSGVGVFVFANKETSAWEAMLSALINAGWIVTASWPIDTESGNRLRAKNSAALASSVHLVCRPRENQDGSLALDVVGDW